MKKYLSMIISTLIICSAAACSSNSTPSSISEEPFSDDTSSVTGISHDDNREEFQKIDTSDLPSKLDLRNYNGKNYVTPVKAQHYGDCWTFALAGSAETAYLCANNFGVQAGEKNEQVNFSEKYIAWYMFHGMTEEDVVSGKVRSSQVGEGFDLSQKESENELAVYTIGGPFVQSANLYGSGFGPVDESVSINGEYPYAYNEESSLGWKLPLNAEYRNAPVVPVFRQSNLLPCPAEIDSNGNYRFNEDGVRAIKEELCQGHGVIVAMNADQSAYSAKKRTSYYSGNEKPNHGVTVVGYDDDFPKENFTKKNVDAQETDKTTPPENGAFIIKNSGGLTTFDGDIDDGYFYLSYYDHSITSPISFEFDNNGESNHTSFNYDQYDLMMTQWYGSTEYSSDTKTANVFDAENDEKLFQIEYRTDSPETKVSYEIYKVTDDNNPSSGTLLEKGVNSHQYAGSHKVDLKNEYALKKGEKYSVVLTMKRISVKDGSMVFTEVFPFSASFEKGLTVKGVINKGESFLFTDGKWNDMTETKDSLLERAYTQCADDLAANKGLPEITLDKSTVTVDNYPIKAILAAD